MARATNPKLVSALIAKVWPEVKLEGKEHYVVCPFCDTDKTKCAINPGKGVFQCWVCGERGPVGKLLSHLRKLGIISQSDVDSIRAGKIGLSDKIKSLADKKGEEEEKSYWSQYVPCVFPPKVHPLYDWRPKGMIEGGVKRAALSYLSRRGVPEDFIKEFRIHVCANLGQRFHGHLFLPVLDEHGKRMKYWTTRTIGQSIPKSYHANSLYSRYKVKTVLVNEHLVKPEHVTEVILCEGPFDAFSLYHVLNIPACPLFGKHLHQYAKERLHHHGVKKIVVCLDEDATEEARKLARSLEGSGFEVSVMEMRGGDPNDVSPENLREIYKEATTDLIGSYSTLLMPPF